MVLLYEDTTGTAYDVYVSGDYAYLADGTSGLAVIDISDPTNPGTPVYEDTTGVALGVYVSGDYAYMADYDSGLAVIDISDPTNPGTPVYEDTSESARAVYVSGDYAYLANSASGLAVIDVSDPTNPGAPVYEDTTGIARNIYVNGDYAYLADGTSGLAIIDISNPTNPGTPVYETTTADAFGIYVSGDYAYRADWISGLAVIDISNSTNPEAPIYEDTSGTARNVYVTGDYAYLTDGPSGLVVIKVRKRFPLGTPIISIVPSDLTVEYGYIGQTLSWTVTDANPETYSIEQLGTGIVVTSTPWTNNTPVVYNIPNGFNLGSYVYTVNFTDLDGNFITDSVTFTVEDTTNPIITVSPNDLTIDYGYSGQNLSWTATDANPDTYTIELLGTGIVAGPTSWTSGSAITYIIPDSFSPGVYTYNITFTDESSNFISNSVTVTINSIDDDDAIPFSNLFLVFVGFSVIYIIFTKKRQIDRESRL